jgi:hypothetical protein
MSTALSDMAVSGRAETDDIILSVGELRKQFQREIPNAVQLIDGLANAFRGLGAAYLSQGVGGALNASGVKVGGGGSSTTTNSSSTVTLTTNNFNDAQATAGNTVIHDLLQP